MTKEEIKEVAKAVALKHAENLAQDLVSEVIRPLAANYIAESENKIDDILLPFIDQVEDALQAQLDKIDGVEGQ